METTRPALAQNPLHPVRRLVVAALCVILGASVAAIVLQRNINRLIQARDWVEHSHDVQASLSTTTLRLDRLDALAHLYLLNRLPNTLRETQDLSVTVETNADHVRTLVSDNPNQTANAKRLAECTRDLVEALKPLGTGGQGFPADIRLQCRETVAEMQEQERVLLQRREKEANGSTQSLIVSGFLLAALSILIVIVLFGALVRDALLRRIVDDRLSESNDQLAENVKKLEDRATELKLLGTARDELQLCVTTKEAYEVAVHFADRLLPETSGALCMIENSRASMTLQSSWGATTNVEESFPLEACCAMRSGQIRGRDPEVSVLHCAHFKGTPPERYACVPMVAHGDTLGVLYIEFSSSEMTQMLENDPAHLRALLQLASMTVAGLNLRSKLENQSIRDSLTGLFNRHFMEISLEREVRRASRRNTSLAVMMIDADHFKEFNDTFGHSAGDAVLREIADKFLASVRGEDIVCRYGGEEFIIILPDISQEKAAERAEQIRATVGALRVANQGVSLGPVTVSIGVAMFPQDGRAVEELLQASDRSLYAAKNRGRNQVVFATEADLTSFPASEHSTEDSTEETALS